MSNLIRGTGSYLPQRIVTNHDIEAMDTDYAPRPGGPPSLHEWAVNKHGAVSRHHVGANESTSGMAAHAGRRALEDAAVEARALDLLVLATFSGDQRLPPAAGTVQADLGCARAKFIQIDAGCSGFVDALLVADGLLKTGCYQTALVIGSDTVSAFNDPKRFMPLTIFGDGAGAVVLQRQPATQDYGIRAFCTGSDGDLGHYVRIPGGGSRLRISEDVLRTRSHYLEYAFPLIHRWGVERLVRCTRGAVERAGISLSDVDWVVAHQASTSILRQVATLLELPFEKFIVTYEHTGNTSAASIPIALDTAKRSGFFSDGDWVVMPTAGAGMAWGAVAYRWHTDDEDRKTSDRATLEHASG